MARGGLVGVVVGWVVLPGRASVEVFLSPGRAMRLRARPPTSGDPDGLTMGRLSAKDRIEEV